MIWGLAPKINLGRILELSLRQGMLNLVLKGDLLMVDGNTQVVNTQHVLIGTCLGSITLVAGAQISCKGSWQHYLVLLLLPILPKAKDKFAVKI